MITLVDNGTELLTISLFMLCILFFLWYNWCEFIKVGRFKK